CPSLKNTFVSSPVIWVFTDTMEKASTVPMACISTGTFFCSTVAARTGTAETTGAVVLGREHAGIRTHVTATTSMSSSFPAIRERVLRAELFITVAPGPNGDQKARTGKVLRAASPVIVRCQGQTPCDMAHIAMCGNAGSHAGLSPGATLPAKGR